MIRPLAFTMVLVLATSVAAQEPTPMLAPAPAGTSADTGQRPIDDVLVAPASDHETHKPGPPFFSCACATNPVFLTWAPDTRRVAQPTKYWLIVGSWPGASDFGVYDMGLLTSTWVPVAENYTYYMRIYAANDFGGNYSATVAVRRSAVPTLYATVNGRVVTLFWTGSQVGTLFYSNDYYFRGMSWFEVNSNVLSYTVPPGTYYFAINTGVAWTPVTSVTVW